MRPRLTLTLAAALAVTLAACGDKAAAPEPQGETTGAAMPDTSAPVADTPLQPAPDAGATGTVPADASPPPVQPTPPAQNSVAPAQ